MNEIEIEIAKMKMYKLFLLDSLLVTLTNLVWAWWFSFELKEIVLLHQIGQLIMWKITKVCLRLADIETDVEKIRKKCKRKYFNIFLGISFKKEWEKFKILFDLLQFNLILSFLTSYY